MSTLSQFAPFAGGGLKSFQTGYVNIASSSASSGSGEDGSFLNVTVSSVSIEKSITGLQGNWGTRGRQSHYFTSDAAANTTFATTRMVSTTALRISNPTPPGGYFSPNLSGRWQLAEAN